MKDELQGNASRRDPRVHHEVMVAVTIGLEASPEYISGWGTNLSVGGVFVNAQSAPAPGTPVSVLLQLPGARDCKLRGRVAWSKQSGPGVDEPGMGVEFLEIDAGTREAISEMVHRLRQDLARPHR